MLRCLICGCSRFDPKGYKCASCGGAHGVRGEECYVTEETKARLLAHAEELRTFGVAVEQHEVIQKSAASDAAGYLALALAVADSLDSGVLRKLVLYLRKIEIPKDEILRLRLDEPEVIAEIFATEWSQWRSFPDPRQGGLLTAPFGPGCYELRHRDGRLVLFGTAGNVAYRMTSLLPEPFGQGHRNHAGKRAYVLEHLEDIEYRTSTSATANEAKVCESELKAHNTYIFST